MADTPGASSGVTKGQPKLAAAEAGQPAQAAGEGQGSQVIEKGGSPTSVGSLVLPPADALLQQHNQQIQDQQAQSEGSAPEDRSNNLTPDEEKFLFSPSDRPGDVGTGGVSFGDPHLPDGITGWLDHLNSLASQPGADPAVIQARNALVRAIMARA